MNTMKAAVVHSFGQPLRVEDRPVPRPGPGQVRVKVATAGVCHTDLHAADGDWPAKPRPPFVPGHEGVGFVDAIGPGATGVKEGDCVGVPWLHTACGRCEHCLGGREPLCTRQECTGYTVDGSFAEYVLADPNYVAPIPPGADLLAIAPILCAGLTVYKGLKVADTRPGQWLVVSGIGGLGHLAVQYARAMGLNVAAVDIDDAKLALARRLGAAVAVNALETDPAAFLQKEIGGAHGVLVTAVSLPAFQQALGMARRGGTLSLVGLPPGDFPLNIFDLVLRGVTVRGSIVGTRLDLREALQFASAGTVHSVVHAEPLENINAVFDRLRAGAIEGRVVLDLRS